MKRKEEITNKLLELIEHVKDAPKNEALLAVGLDIAEWTDEHPREANIAAYLGKKGWPLSTYGIPTFEEASKTLDEYYEYKKKQWFDKAVGWLESNTMKELCLDLGETQSIREFIDNFKEAMKE